MATPTDRFPDPFVTATFVQYGITMLAVQEWEQAVASLVGAAKLRSAPADGKSFERALRVAAKHSSKLIRRGTASAMRKALESFQDDEIMTKGLIAALAELNETRSYLIHSYLTDHIYADTEQSHRTAVVAELLGLHEQFTETTDQMARATYTLLNTSELSKRPKKMRIAIEQLSSERRPAQPAPLARPSVGEPSPEAVSIKSWERRGAGPNLEADPASSTV